MINFDELNIGDIVYSYAQTLGIINKCEYLGDQKCLLNGKEFWTDDLVPASFYPTEEEAIVNSYVINLNHVEQKIESLKKDIEHQINLREQLDNKYGYLRNKYPELFV